MGNKRHVINFNRKKNVYIVYMYIYMIIFLNRAPLSIINSIHDLDVIFLP